MSKRNFHAFRLDLGLSVYTVLSFPCCMSAFKVMRANSAQHAPVL